MKSGTMFGLFSEALDIGIPAQRVPTERPKHGMGGEECRQQRQQMEELVECKRMCRGDTPWIAQEKERN